MRRSFVAFLSLAAALAACESSTSPADRLRVTTTLSAESFRVGERVEVNVVARNVGSETVRVLASGCAGGFTVSTPGGAVVGPAPRFCTLEHAVRDIAPGESYGFTAEWAGDASSVSPPSPPETVEPGRYLIRGFVSVDGDGRARSPEVEVQLLP